MVSQEHTLPFFVSDASSTSEVSQRNQMFFPIPEKNSKSTGLDFHHDTQMLSLLSAGNNGINSNDMCFASTVFPCSSSSSMNRASLSLSTFPLGNSVFLKPVQSLLDETVSVGGEAIHMSHDRYFSRVNSTCRKIMSHSSELRPEFCPDGLSISEKNQLQTILNLVSLLEEVDSRWNDYYQRMEEVVSSFEAIAGIGAAKSYTTLALLAMSRHFDNLRNTIVSQINTARRKASKDFPKIHNGLWQLNQFNQEIRQNRDRLLVQQIGCDPQAWRPVRGLPETSVAVLRAWLFEHFLHPYPNDSEKIMLASQSRLSKNQVSNWFINARVRLWKPMIEEMYKEEFEDTDTDSLLAINH